MKHVHLVGIGGTGLSAIARVLLERGYTVSGSDSKASPLFEAVTDAGAQTYLGHTAKHIAGADLVVRSSAIPDENPEVAAAREQGIPVVKRKDFLAELTADQDTLAIAGSHGKTTTTAMLVWTLEVLGMSPSFIVGGMVSQLACNARAGTGRYFAIEADEYDLMFLGLRPKIAVITNIEHDHPDCFPTEEDYLAAFRQFLNRVRPDGVALVCKEDPQLKELIKSLDNTSFQMKTYGVNSDVDYFAENLEKSGGFPAFTLSFQDPAGEKIQLGRVHLAVPGFHNVLNATAVLGIIHILNLPLEKAIEALSKFTGTGRRFEILGEVHGITIIDDYGHHPTQIRATLEAARSLYPKKRIWAVWEPHTYTRTQTLENDFIKALSIADRVGILKIYAAREENPGYSAAQIADAMPDGKAVYLADFSAAKAYLLNKLESGDVLILFSAGDATEVSRDVLANLEEFGQENRKGSQHG